MESQPHSIDREFICIAVTFLSRKAAFANNDVKSLIVRMGARVVKVNSRIGARATA